MSSLYRNRLGAMSVIGLFMAIFATGAIWYVIGVGNAVLYRERVQDGADAVAFAGAVYHARGMNIIVTLNLLMAALLGLVVVARLLRFLNTTANVIGCACTPVPYIGAVCASICSVTSSLQSPLNTLESNLTNLYNRLGPVLSKTQRGIAIAMPWVAQAKAIGVSQTYAPDVRFGVIVSRSLAPSGDRLGLPVQEGEESVLCGKVSSGIAELVFKPLVFLPGEGLIRGWLEDTIAGFVSVFCGGGELIDPEKVREIEQDAANDQTDARCDWEQELAHAMSHPLAQSSSAVIMKARRDHATGAADLGSLQCYGVQSDGYLADLPAFGAYKGKSVPASVIAIPSVDEAPNQLLGCPFSRSECEQRTRSEIQQKQAAAKSEQEQGGSVEIDQTARQQTTPKVLFEDAASGNSYFQVWSLVFADDARATKPARGVEIAARGSSRADELTQWSRLGWAQAEFYYDHEGEFDEDVADEAMWSLRWRARLRRVRPPTIDILEGLAGGVFSKIASRLSDGGAGDDDAGALESLFTEGFGAASEALEEQVEEAAIAGDNAIEEKARQAWRSVGGVH